MNIKGLLGPNIAPQVRSTEKVDRSGIQADASHDRDANGQQTFDGQEQHGSMSEEQLQKAMEHLRQMAVVKEHHWSVELLVVAETKLRFVLIKDSSGTLIRRIPEAELWTLPLGESAPKGKGSLLKKTA